MLDLTIGFLKIHTLRFRYSSPGRMAAVLIAGLLVSIAASVSGWTQTPATAEAASLAAWDKIVAVLQHPRCLNCHQLDRPLQGDTRRVHIPTVTRGADDLGTGTMRCYNCHNDTGNNEMAGVPGALHWKLAPASMLWQGLSSSDLCRMLRNPELNGHLTPEKIVEHMDTEDLVQWGWKPGGRRAPIPISHREFVDLVKVWVSGDSACPQR
jgi:hypothetical protein